MKEGALGPSGGGGRTPPQGLWCSAGLQLPSFPQGGAGPSPPGPHPLFPLEDRWDLGCSQAARLGRHSEETGLEREKEDSQVLRTSAAPGGSREVKQDRPTEEGGRPCGHLFGLGRRCPRGGGTEGLALPGEVKGPVGPRVNLWASRGLRDVHGCRRRPLSGGRRGNTVGTDRSGLAGRAGGRKPRSRRERP